MADRQQELRELREREWEADLLDYRGIRINGARDWKKRITLVDALYAGRWNEVFPDETVMNENPHVMNLVQTAMDDTAKLVSEATPTTRCFPREDTEKARENALRRAIVADTYWAKSDGDLLTPRFALDIMGAGGAFAVASWDDDGDDDDYPSVYRVDPRYCYPDIRNGKLINLLVVESINYRIAARMFPALGLSMDNSMRDKSVELVHYYEPGLCMQGIAHNVTGVGDPKKVAVTKVWEPKNVKGRPIMTAASAQADTNDGMFRGMFDQIGGSLQTKNRIIKQLLDYTDEIVYAERYSKGLLNPDEPPGPMAHFRLDPTVTDAVVGRVAPAASAPQVFQMVEYLDREQRGAVGYPSSRQGEVSQSIASATFVASTQGQLTSTVRNIARLEGAMRERLNRAMFQIDEAYIDRNKPLIRPHQKKQTYRPSIDINGQYESKVVYGASAGLDRISADNRVLQLLGANVISRQTARENIDFIDDPRAQEEQIELEATNAALVQKLLSDAPPDMLLQLVADQADGLSIADSAKKILDAQKQQQEEAAGQPGVPGQPAVPGAPQPGAGGLPQPESVFGLPPAEQVQVQTPRPTRPTQFH